MTPEEKEAETDRLVAARNKAEAAYEAEQAKGDARDPDAFLAAVDAMMSAQDAIDKLWPAPDRLPEHLRLKYAGAAGSA